MKSKPQMFGDKEDSEDEDWTETNGGRRKARPNNPSKKKRARDNSQGLIESTSTFTSTYHRDRHVL